MDISTLLSRAYRRSRMAITPVRRRAAWSAPADIGFRYDGVQTGWRHPVFADRPQEDLMEKRQLGQSSLHVHPITFGGNVFGWTADEAMSFKLLDAFVAAGFNFIDSADVYSRWHPGNKGGESETILGAWLKARGGRDKVIIATKLGIEMSP